MGLKGDYIVRWIDLLGVSEKVKPQNFVSLSFFTLCSSIYNEFVLSFEVFPHVFVYQGDNLAIVYIGCEPPPDTHSVTSVWEEDFDNTLQSDEPETTPCDFTDLSNKPGSLLRHL